MDRQYLSVYTPITDESPPMDYRWRRQRTKWLAPRVALIVGMNHFRIELHKQ